jgi:NAD(P)-dependent dehydrogenase (short-subunit alcohol dehydrogenase family)
MSRAGRDPDDVGGQNSMGRAGTPEEIAWPILFLVSDAASFISGQTLAVNGGPPAPRFG